MENVEIISDTKKKKKNSPSNICFFKKRVYHSTHYQQQELKKNYSFLAENLVLKPRKPQNNFWAQSVKSYYKKYNLKEKLLFSENE